MRNGYPEELSGRATMSALGNLKLYLFACQWNKDQGGEKKPPRTRQAVTRVIKKNCGCQTPAIENTSWKCTQAFDSDVSFARNQWDEPLFSFDPWWGRENVLHVRPLVVSTRLLSVGSSCCPTPPHSFLPPPSHPWATGDPYCDLFSPSGPPNRRDRAPFPEYLSYNRLGGAWVRAFSKRLHRRFWCRVRTTAQGTQNHGSLSRITSRSSFHDHPNQSPDTQ